MGKIEIDHTGSGGGITLSSDGTSLLLGGTAVGGSALELYAENPSTPTTPLAGGTNGVAIGSGSNAGGSGAIAIGVGSAAGDGAFCAINGGGNTAYGAVGNRSIAMGEAARSQGQDSVAIGENSLASAADSFAIGYNTDATGTNAAAFGYNAQAAGIDSIALGNSRAGGTDSFAAVIDNNTSSYGATSSNSIALGWRAKASGTFGTSIGYQTQATAGNSVAVGRSCVASGSQSTALGYQSLASGEYSTAIGRNAKAELIGKLAYAAADFGASSLYSQTGIYVLLADTTDATAEALTTNRSTVSSNNQIILANNAAYAFHGTIVARQQASGGTASAAWKVEGLIRREGSAGTTVLVNSATTVLDNTPSWGMALSADTTNGGLAITVTGEASTNIRWVATIHTSEVTYA